MDYFIKKSDALKVIESASRMVSCLNDAIIRLCVTMHRISDADVAEVVRCKDCKHYVPAEDDGEMMCVKDADWCVEDGCYYGFTDSHDADWFCADGERKGEEQ